ncbi:MAG: hypothetical protein H6741_21500 [Alphaproteobacteria bacterium]|nr:hypothetical protein [Alphaproteobacteria bacterium]
MALRTWALLRAGRADEARALSDAALAAHPWDPELLEQRVAMLSPTDDADALAQARAALSAVDPLYSSAP